MFQDRRALRLALHFAALAFAIGFLAPSAARAAGELGYPVDATPLASSSGTQAAAAATATLAATVGHKTFICGFVMTSTGSTAAAVVAPTVTGTFGGTQTYAYASVAGVTLANQSLVVAYTPCLAASAAGVNIVVTLPSLGAGSTNATTNAWGYLQ
jgi:hypothetical protein